MQRQKKTVSIKDALRAKAGIVIEPPTAPAFDRAAIERGRQPIGPDRPNPPALTPIEASFKFSGQSSDEDHHYLHVEPLLGQAQQLLDRCALLKAEHQRLQHGKRSYQRDLDRLTRLDALRRRERQAGLDTLPYQRSVLAAAAEKCQEENHAHAEAQLKALLEDLLASGFNKRMAARELTAWLASYPLKDSELGGDEAIYTFDGAGKSKADHLFDAARIETDEAAWEQAYSLMHRRYLDLAAAEAAALRRQAAELDSAYALADIAFRGEKAQIDRDHAAAGLIDPSEQLTLLEQSFASQFRDALACLRAAARGLKALYGYEPELPKEGSPNYFEQVVSWTAHAASRAAQLAQTDQRYVLALSLKELTQGQWESGKSAAQWTFNLPDSLFPAQTHVRLRGLSLQVAAPKPEEAEAPKSKAASAKLPPPEPAKPQGYWNARVSVPPAATIHGANGAPRELDQKLVPVCFLGSVSGNESEPAGVNTLHNASPIGNGWKIALSPKST